MDYVEQGRGQRRGPRTAKRKGGRPVRRKESLAGNKPARSLNTPIRTPQIAGSPCDCHPRRSPIIGLRTDHRQPPISSIHSVHAGQALAALVRREYMPSRLSGRHRRRLPSTLAGMHSSPLSSPACSAVSHSTPRSSPSSVACCGVSASVANPQNLPTRLHQQEPQTRALEI